MRQNIFRLCVLACLVLFSSGKAKAQEPVKADTSVGWRLFFKAIAQVREKQLERALPYLLQATDIFEGAEDQKGTMRCNYALARYFDGMIPNDSSRARYQRVYDAFTDDVTDLNLRGQFVKSCNMLGFYTLLYEEDAPASLVYQQRALEILETLPVKDQCTLIGRTHNFISNIYYLMGDLDKQLQHLKLFALFSREDKGKESFRLGMAYNNLAVYYQNLLDYTKAREYLEQALDVYTHNPNASTLVKGVLYSNIGNNYRQTGKFSQALTYHLRGRELTIEAVGPLHYKTAVSNNNIGNTYYKMKDFANARRYFSMALEAKTNTVGINVTKGFALAHLSGIETYEGNHKKGDSLFARFEEITAPVRFKGKRYCTMFRARGFYLHKVGRNQEALEALQRSLTCMVPQFESKVITENPDPTVHAISMPIMLALRMKAMAFNSLFRESGEQKWLEHSWKTYKVIASFMDSLRVDFKGTSRIVLMSNYRPVYAGGIGAALDLAELTGDRRYLESAWKFSEQSRASNLLSAFREAGARYIANIPRELIDEEQRISTQVGLARKSYDKLLFSRDADDPELMEASKKLFLLKEDQDSLIQRFEQQFPDYYRFKYNLSYASIEQTQTYCREREQELIEFFVGDSTMYVFRVNADSIQVVSLEAAPILKEMQTQLLANIEGRGSLASYHTIAPSFFQALFSQVFANEVLPPRLLLIPDGFLAYVPFEALVINNPAEEQARYWVEQSALSYGWSATLAVQGSKHQELAANAFLGIAPSFSGKTEKSPLAYNLEEVNQAESFIQGKKIVGGQACKSRFLQATPQSRVIHISSHAEVNDSVPALSGIFFSDACKGEEEQVLSLAEVYAMDLRADLTVLSACETSSGQLAKGEGVLSLARGFALAGSRSIITSLWQVNHNSNRQILGSFYSELVEGQDLDEALRQAKIRYLHDENRSAEELHPYYWAAMVAVGDVESLEWIDGSGGFIWLLIGGVLLLLGAVYLIRRSV